MEQSQTELEDFIVKRLIDNTEEVSGDGLVIEKPDAPVKRGGDEVLVAQTTALQHNDADEAGTVIAPTTSFTKVEKSLASLGFFTPSSKRLKDQKKKTITFTREIDGKRLEVTADIIPSALFGLPVTADQDKYLALQKIITNVLQAQGKVSNPIRFKSSELLRLLNHNTKTGTNYKEVSEWLDVMSSTTIFSNGVVYVAGQKRFAKDRFRVFDRAVSVGKEMEDGSIADANYVWLSSWQLENINNNFVLPIDLETYRELKNHIAKALVPLLQVWLFATQKAGSFEKRYTELCEILTLQQYRTPSQITRQLKPSLDELMRYEYLEKWRIERTSDQKSFKVVFFHGAKFHRDRRKRLEQKRDVREPMIVAESEPMMDLPVHGKQESAELQNVELRKGASDRIHGAGVTSAKVPAEHVSKVERPPEHLHIVVSELTSRGVMQSEAIELLNNLTAAQIETIPDYADYWDSIRPDSERGKGPGLLVYFIKKGDPLPPGFETRRAREEREATARRREKLRVLKEVLETEYEEHRRVVVDRFISDVLTQEEFERRVITARQKSSQQTGFWGDASPQLADQLARRSVRAEVAQDVNILSFEDFRRREMPRILGEFGIDPKDVGIETPPQSPLADVPAEAVSVTEDRESPKTDFFI